MSTHLNTTTIAEKNTKKTEELLGISLSFSFAVRVLRLSNGHIVANHSKASLS